MKIFSCMALLFGFCTTNAAYADYYWQTLSLGHFPSLSSACEGLASSHTAADGSAFYVTDVVTFTSRFGVPRANCISSCDICPSALSEIADASSLTFKLDTPLNDAPLQCPIGNPIDPSTGNKYQLEPLIANSGLHPVNLDLVFNSSRPEKWRHTYSRSVVRVSDIQQPNNTFIDSFCETSTSILEASGGFGRTSSVSAVITKPKRFSSQGKTAITQTTRYSAQSACEDNWADLKPQFHYSWTNNSTARYAGNGHCEILDNTLTKRMTLNVYQTGGIRADRLSDFECSEMDPTKPPLLDSPNPINVRFTRQNGGVVRFTYNTTTSTLENNSKAGERAEFIIDDTDITGYRFYSKEDEIEEYDAEGKLLTITSLDGHVQKLTYIEDTINPGNFLLSRIQNGINIDPDEHIDIVYETVDVINPFNRIKNFIQHSNDTSRSWNVRYDANENPEFIDNPDGTSRQYHYDIDPDRLGYLTGITDERGNRYATWTYNATGKANSSAHGPDADIDKVTITYNETNNSHTITKLRKSGIDDVVTPIDSTYYTHAAGGSKVVAKITGPGCSACGASDVDYEHNPDTGYLEYKIENSVREEYGNYDGKGNAGFIIEAVGTEDERRVDYVYDSRFYNKISTITEPSIFTGSYKVITNTYDDFGNRLTETIDGFKPDGTTVSRTTTYEYLGPFNQLSKIDGPRTDVNDIINFEYYTDEASLGNNRARLRHVIDENGNYMRSSINYTATGKIENEYRSNNLYIGYSYTLYRDRLSGMFEYDFTTSYLRTTNWTYLPTGEVKTITRAQDTIVETKLILDYDDARRLTRVTDGLGNYIEYILDSEGNIEKENIHDASNILNKTLTKTFDEYNQLDNFSEKNRKTNSDFNFNGTLDKITDGKGNITGYIYDDLLRLTQVVQDQGGTDPTTADALTQYDYDAQDNLISVTDANDGQTIYVYDDLGNLLSQTSPDTGINHYTHDEAGNVATQTDAKGQLFSYVYDHNNRLTSIDAPDTEDDVVYVYDTCAHGYGRLCEVTRNNSTTRYQYNAMGDVLNVAQEVVTWAGYNQSNNVLVYSYDGTGRVKTITYPSGAVVMYDYDAAGDVSSVILDQNTTQTNLFNVTRRFPFGAINNATYGNSQSYFGYVHNDYRPWIVSGSQQYTTVYYDNNGNPTQMYYPQGQNILIYDTHDRLNTVFGDLGGFDYDYDTVGNKTQFKQDGVATSMEYNVNSNLMNTLGSEAVVMDANGNTTALRGMTLSFTADNRLKMSNTGVLFEYNGLGQRIMKKTMALGVAGSTYGYSQSVIYLYGLNGELLVEMGPTGKVVKEYIYMEGKPLAMLDHKANSGEDFLNADLDNDGSISVEDYLIYYFNYRLSSDPAYDVNGDGVKNADDNQIVINCGLSQGACEAASYSTSIYYIHNDHLGTPKLMTDELGAHVWSATATPFGKASVNNDVDGDGNSVTLNIRQPGQFYDGETGLYYNYYRYYDPETGRYITSDPIGLLGGINTYAYVENNPLNFIDPLGLYKNCTRPLKGSPFGQHGYIKFGSGDTISWGPASGISGPGKINENDSGGTCGEDNGSTPEEDQNMRDWAKKHEKDFYSPVGYNCFNFRADAQRNR